MNIEYFEIPITVICYKISVIIEKVSGIANTCVVCCQCLQIIENAAFQLEVSKQNQ